MTRATATLLPPDQVAPSAFRSLADTFGLGVTEARRDMETVQNWLAFLTPA